jgi:hypothetical protein
MGRFFLAYVGGQADDEFAMDEDVTSRWMKWFGALGTSLLDAGGPFEEAGMVLSDGSVSSAPSIRLSGYSIISAPSLSAALEIARACPITQARGQVLVYEISDL